MSVLHPLDARGLGDARPLPWTRARANRSWRTALASIATVRFLVLALLPVVAGVPFRELLPEIPAAAIFPALFIGIVGFCERRFLRRPPKAVLAAQLACFCTGGALQLAANLGAPALEPLSVAVLSGSTLLIGGWFVGVLLVPED